MTQKPLTYYVSVSPAVQDLIDTYGPCLEGMLLDEKLLVIQCISGALMDGMVDSDFGFSIEAQVLERVKNGYAVSLRLERSLKMLDACNKPQCFALLIALAAYSCEDYM